MRVVVSSIAMAALWLQGAAVAAQEPAAPVTLSLPAQPLRDALNSLARHTGLQVIYTADEVTAGLTAPGLEGRFTAESALSALLENSGLTFEFLNARTVAITIAGASKPTTIEAETRLLRSDGGFSSALHPSATGGAANRLRVAQAGRASDSMANRDTNEPEKLVLDEIVVVGSRLAAPAGAQALPAKVIAREEIERSGAASIVQVLNQLTEVSIQSTTSPSQAGTFRGSSTVQLRGLPAGTTLVLLNGRRVAGSPYQGHASSGVTNLNMLPLNAVERIEVLPAGSSAVHGGDALGGVVNIVLKKEFSGLDTLVRYGAADGYDETQASLGWGWQSDRASFSVIATYADNSELQGFERAITANNDYRSVGGHDASQPYMNPGNVYSLNGQNLPGLSSPFAGVPANTDGIGLTPADFSAGVLNRNSSFFANAAQRPVTRQSGALASGIFHMTSDVELFTELLYTRYRATDLNFPRYTIGQPAANIVPASNPFNPFDVPVGVSYLFDGGGRHSFHMESEYYRPLVGARGSFGAWRWEMAANMTRGKDEDELQFMNNAAINAALADTNPQTALNPFAARTWTPAEIAPFVSSRSGSYESELGSVDGFVRGPLLRTRAGEVQALFGAQYDRSELGITNFVSTTDPGTFSASDRDSYAVFGEVRVPLIGPREEATAERLVLSGAVRYDHYSDFGSRTSPQVGLELRPVDALLLRAAYSSTYKPPTLYQLYFPVSFFPVNVIPADPRRGGQSYTAASTFGGNPNLEPLTGESTSFGFVLAPETVAGLELSMSHWTAKLEDYVSTIGIPTLVRHEALFPEYVRREEPTPQDVANGFAGRIVQVDSVFVNFGTFDLAGVDLGLRWATDTPIGELVPAVSVTHTYRYDAALVPGAPREDRAGKANCNGYAPQWKGIANLAWNTSRAQVSVTGRYVGQYEDYAPSTRKLGDFWLFDLNLRTDIGRLFSQDAKYLAGTSLSLGVVNLFDELPEYSLHAGQVGYDPSQYDIRGRFVYAQLGVKF